VDVCFKKQRIFRMNRLILANLFIFKWTNQSSRPYCFDTCDREQVDRPKQENNLGIGRGSVSPLLTPLFPNRPQIVLGSLRAHGLLGPDNRDFQQPSKRHFQAQRNERGPVKTISLRMLVANVVVLLMCMAVGRAQTVTGTVTGSAVRSVERHLQFSANYRF
jgi:hypothetical protein